MPFKRWISFWFCRKPEMNINLNGHRLIIRTNTLPAKIVDLYMAASCIVGAQYSPEHFDIKDNDTIIDIGAHIGSYTIFAARQAKNGHVLAFEPDPDNYTQLRKNIKENNLSNIIVSSMAVSDKTGTIFFNKDTLNTAESSLYKSGNKTISVESTTLAEIFKKEDIKRCNILKLDCEGAEYNIMFETPDAVFERIDKIVMENHTPQYFDITDPRYTEKNMIERLKHLGYSVRIIPENAMHSLIFAQRS